jgi:hypothetical protein
VTSWIDESLIQSELCGALLILVIAWILLLQSLLWQAWMREHYLDVVRSVAQSLGADWKTGWHWGLEIAGRQERTRYRVAWRGSPCAIGTRVFVRRGWWHRRRWIGRPGVGTDRILASLSAATTELGGEG